MKNIKITFIVGLSVLLLSFSSSVYEGGLIKKKGYSIEVPGFLYEMDDLNSDADLQMGYVKQRNDVVEELYAIVLLETKKEIKSYDLGYEFNARTYWDVGVASIGETLDEYSIDTPDPKIEIHNKLPRVTSVMHGKFGEVSVTYQMAVYEGKKAFYQVLTWTLTEQLDMFQSDMNSIIDSFKSK